LSYQRYVELAVSGTVSITNPQCISNTRFYTIQLTPSGGSGVYQVAYELNEFTEPTSRVQSNERPIALVRDVRTNLIVDVVTPQPFASWGLLSATAVITSSSGTDGTIVVSVTGGIGPFTYQNQLMGSPQSDNQFTLLAAGSYSVTVVDSVGCFFTFTAWVPEVSSLTASVDQVNTVGSQCTPKRNGRITVLASGGNSPYRYYLDNGAASVSNVFTSVAGGYHDIAVQDNVGRFYNISYLLFEPLPVKISWRLTYQFALYNWGFAASATGGFEPRYYWLLNSTRVGSSSFEMFINARAYGAYTLTAISAGDCSASVTAYFYPPHEVSTIPTSVSCNGLSDGILNATVTRGGSGVFSYRLRGEFAWSASNIFTGLSAGTYQIEVLDNLTSVISSSFGQVSEPGILFVTVSGIRTNPSSVQGALQFSVSGGNRPYQISVTSDGGYSDTSDALARQSLSVATYQASVVDSRGCGASLPAAYPLYSVVSLQTFATHPSCHNSLDGEVSISASGGNGDYLYALAPALGTVANYSTLQWQASNVFQNLPGGSYLALVKDSAMPPDVFTSLVALENPQPLVLSYLSTGTIPSTETASVKFSITGGVGPYQLSYGPLFSGQPVTASYTYSGVGISNYTASAVDDHGCLSPQVNVAVYEIISLSTDSVIDVSCRGALTGQITLVAAGGSGNYRFRVIRRGENTDWQSSPVFSNLPAGIYSFLVEDTRDEAYSTTLYGVVVSQPQLALQVLLASVSRSVFASATGSVQVLSVGNQGTVEYQLDSLAFVAQGNFQNISSGEHNITVRDSVGCKASTSVSIFSIPEVQIVTSRVSCNGRSDGSATLIVSGGKSPMTFRLLPTGTASSTASFNGLAAGPMFVRLEDSGLDGANVFEFAFTVPEADPIVVAVQTFQRGSQVIVHTSGGAGGPYRWQPDGIEGADLLFNGPFPTTKTVLDSVGCPARVELNVAGYCTIFLSIGFHPFSYSRNCSHCLSC
jgi:hypothetical protein